MKIAIDSYCYHRNFGDFYAGLQQPAAKAMTIWDFLRRAQQLGVAGVSLESCYFTSITDDFLAKLNDELDARSLERVWAWGHPCGLCSGTNRQAAREAHRAHTARASHRGGGHAHRRRQPADAARFFRRTQTPVGENAAQLLPAAEEHGVVLAMENHIDLTADEMVDVITTVNSRWLGVCLDTGNNLRLHEDPVVVAQKLAPLTRATHIKDLWVRRGDPKDFAFWPSVPLGKGLVDIGQILGLLKKARYRRFARHRD